MTCRTGPPSALLLLLLPCCHRWLPLLDAAADRCFSACSVLPRAMPLCDRMLGMLPVMVPLLLHCRRRKRRQRQALHHAQWAALPPRAAAAVADVQPLLEPALLPKVLPQVLPLTFLPGG